MARFQNFLTDEMTDDAVEERNGRFFIKMFHAGCNTRTNNGNGYATKAKAEATVIDYQNRR